MSKADKKPNMRQIVISKPRTHATWSKDAPMRITKQTVFTVCPAMPQPTQSNTHSKF